MDAMLDRMSPRQLAERRAYVEVLGAADDEQLAANVVAAVVNEVRMLRSVVEAFMGLKQHDKPVAADDYVRRWREDRPAKVKRQTPQQLYQMLRSLSG